MTDYTAEVAELTAAYSANRVANAAIAIEVRAKYRDMIAEEIQQRKRENDLKFARHLADVKGRSEMPLSVIQDHVLHTKSWDRWTYWRDLAEIQPERVTVANAKKAASRENATFVWAEDYSTLTVQKNSRGERLTQPIVYDMATNQKVRGNLWWPNPVEDNEVEAETARADGGYLKMLSAEIQSKIEEGVVNE